MAVHSFERCRTTRDAAKRGHTEGFVLALTLWVIALFGLGVAAINTWVTTATENARALRQRVDDELMVSNVKNEIVYAIATRPLTYRGLEVGSGFERPKVDDLMMNAMGANVQSSQYVAFDRRPYIMESDPNYYVRIQDGRGLVNLNRITPVLLRRLLAFYDTSENQRNQLPETLQDWIDEDELTRLAGAEAPDYERRNRLPPPNARLMTPQEAQNILGWDEVPKMWEDDLKAPIFSTCSTSGFNPNTAPEASLLAHIPGLTEDAAKFIVNERYNRAFRHARDFMEIANVSVANEAFFFGVSPGDCMIVDVVNRSSNEKTRISLTIVSRSENQPWQVDYVTRLPSQYRGPLDELDPHVTFPTPETLAASFDGTDGVSGIR